MFYIIQCVHKEAERERNEILRRSIKLSVVMNYKTSKAITHSPACMIFRFAFRLSRSHKTNQPKKKQGSPTCVCATVFGAQQPKTIRRIGF